jgi:hypothetical protein
MTVRAFAVAVVHEYAKHLSFGVSLLPVFATVWCEEILSTHAERASPSQYAAELAAVL